MKYTPQERQRISFLTAGKVVESLEYEETGQFWVMTFTDNSEISFRMMAELT